MPWYLIGNGRTGEWIEAEAVSVPAACAEVGWRPDDCEVLLLRRTPRPKSRDPLTRRDVDV